MTMKKFSTALVGFFTVLACVATLTAQTTIFVPSGTVGTSSNGNVGIGTSSPTEKLEIDGTVRINTTNQTGILAFGNRDQGAGYYDTGVYRGSIGLTTAGNYLNVSGYAGIVFNSSASALGSQTTRMYIDGAAGNVGIGTTSPAQKLQVWGTARFGADANGFVDIYNQQGTSEGGVINLRSNTGTNMFLEDFNGVFRLVNSGWTASLFSVDQSGNGYFPGNVGIGTTNPTQKLSVNGTIQAKEVIVQTGWSDYVFAKGYRLAPLAEIEQHIEKDGHLPGIPSAQEVAEHGVRMGDMQAKLMAKIEEITLHQIAQEKEIFSLKQGNATLRKENAEEIAMLRGQLAELKASHR